MQRLTYRFALSLVLSGILLSLSSGCTSSEKDQASFSVVLLPDTQFYSEKYPGTYLSQTYWIKDRAAEDNIKFVIHLGDIVQSSWVEEQWVNADRAHRVLDGAVPYSIVPGNHDVDKGPNHKGRVRSTKFFDKYFPPSRFAGNEWYGGTMEEGNNRNNYCFFEACGMKFIVISLEYAPRDKTLEWAGRLLKKYPNRRAILATHYHLRSDGRGSNPERCGLSGNVGQDLWDKFIRKHANLFMVVCGHIHGTYHQTDTNNAGGKVHEILCDYQSGPNGGDGWLQILRFVPGENRIDVIAYSPLLDQYNKDLKHTYSLDYDMGAKRRKKAG